MNKELKKYLLELLKVLSLLIFAMVFGMVMLNKVGDTFPKSKNTFILIPYILISNYLIFRIERKSLFKSVVIIVCQAFICANIVHIILLKTGFYETYSARTILLSTFIYYVAPFAIFHYRKKLSVLNKKRLGKK